LLSSFYKLFIYDKGLLPKKIDYVCCVGKISDSTCRSSEKTS
jgi:hypothetical protein